MSIAEQIKRKITESLAPEHLELINESHKHKGHAGDNGTGESHFKLIVVSSKFEGYDRIQRHRMVFTVLNEELNGKIHALSIAAYTPAEYRRP